MNSIWIQILTYVFEVYPEKAFPIKSVIAQMLAEAETEEHIDKAIYQMVETLINEDEVVRAEAFRYLINGYNEIRSIDLTSTIMQIISEK